LTVKEDNRTEEQKIKDRLLMLYVIGECEKAGVEVTEERLQYLIFLIQKGGEADGIETFSYDDWEMK